MRVQSVRALEVSVAEGESGPRLKALQETPAPAVALGCCCARGRGGPGGAGRAAQSDVGAVVETGRAGLDPLRAGVHADAQRVLGNRRLQLGLGRRQRRRWRQEAVTGQHDLLHLVIERNDLHKVGRHRGAVEDAVAVRARPVGQPALFLQDRQDDFAARVLRRDLLLGAAAGDHAVRVRGPRAGQDVVDPLRRGQAGPRRAAPQGHVDIADPPDETEGGHHNGCGRTGGDRLVGRNVPLRSQLGQCRGDLVHRPVGRSVRSHAGEGVADTSGGTRAAGQPSVVPSALVRGTVDHGHQPTVRDEQFVLVRSSPLGDRDALDHLPGSAAGLRP
ncbi:hypothetical protein [Streptomyces sp. NPDC057386]|uniref:hypothetical protein n=1 Tax=unclassified Streptomyces TaxID=2593676 RepID=UPI00362B5DC1